VRAYCSGKNLHTEEGNLPGRKSTPARMFFREECPQSPLDIQWRGSTERNQERRKNVWIGKRGYFLY
jgi:hypothetical protein